MSSISLRTWSPRRLLVWGVLAMTTLVSLYPLYGMYVTALTPTFDTVKTPPDIIPIHASIENFQRLLLKARDYPRWFSNSLLITLSITYVGVFGAWTDSIPMLVISGQVKRETCITSYQIPGLRQIGDQEADIISMAKGITKYAVTITDPQTVRYHLERALHLATIGRPGPCWLNIPIDVQASQIDPAALVCDIEVVGRVCGPVCCSGEPADHDEVDVMPAKARQELLWSEFRTLGRRHGSC